MTNITSTLGLTRENLVAMALLLGCDYCAVGLPGIGETRAMRLMHSLKGHNILTRSTHFYTVFFLYGLQSV